MSFIVHWLRTVDILHGDSKQQVNAAGVKDTNCSSGSENIGLVVQHPMLSLSGKATWIIDSGATSHMCNDQSLFVEYESLKTSGLRLVNENTFCPNNTLFVPGINLR